jgi:nucleoid-associated protein YgaU
VLPLLAAGAVAVAAPGALHEVRRGETLASIARATLGDARLWPALYRANRDQIKDPAVLHPGQRLHVPAIAPEDGERDAEALQSR